MIENHFYYLLQENNYWNDYISLLSIILIQNPISLTIYYGEKNKKDLGFFKDLPNCQFKGGTQKNVFIDVHKKGGVYLYQNIILLKKISTFFEQDLIFYKDVVLGYSKNKIKNNEMYLKDEFSTTIDDSCFKEIYDYNFSNYFNIIYNYYFLHIPNIDGLHIDQLKGSKITCFNLIIYYILGFQFYFSKQCLSDNYYLLNGISKIFWINMDTSLNRRKNMINLLDKINKPNERIKAIDGSLMNNIRDKYFEYSDVITNNSNNEYAVIVSHLKTLERITFEEGDYFLICEDDICFDFIRYWKKPLKDILEQAPRDWEILMLGYFSLNTKFYIPYRKWNNDWSAMSYVIKKSALRKFNFQEKFPLFNDVNVADNYLFRTFSTYVYQFPFFTISNTNSSTFHKDHDHYQKIYKNLNYVIHNDCINKYFSIS